MDGLVVCRGELFSGPHLPVPDVVVGFGEEDMLLVLVSGVVLVLLIRSTRDEVPILVRGGFEEHFCLEVGRLADVRDDGSHGCVRRPR